MGGEKHIQYAPKILFQNGTPTSTITRVLVNLHTRVRLNNFWADGPNFVYSCHISETPDRLHGPTTWEVSVKSCSCVKTKLSLVSLRKNTQTAEDLVSRCLCVHFSIFVSRCFSFFSNKGQKRHNGKTSPLLGVPVVPVKGSGATCSLPLHC